MRWLELQREQMLLWRRQRQFGTVALMSYRLLLQWVMGDLGLAGMGLSGRLWGAWAWMTFWSPKVRCQKTTSRFTRRKRFRR